MIAVSEVGFIFALFSPSLLGGSWDLVVTLTTWPITLLIVSLPALDRVPELHVGLEAPLQVVAKSFQPPCTYGLLRGARGPYSTPTKRTFRGSSFTEDRLYSSSSMLCCLNALSLELSKLT